MPCQKGGQSTGRKLKAAKITLPGEWQGFAAWLLQALEVEREHGKETAEEFLKESRRRFVMTDAEAKFARELLGLVS